MGSFEVGLTSRRPAVGRGDIPEVREKPFIEDCKLVVCAGVNCCLVAACLGTSPSSGLSFDVWADTAVGT